jgi:putative hemolysin
MTTLALYILVFLFLSGLMAAVDAAVLSVTRPEIEELIHNHRPGARRLRQVKQQLARSVVVIVVLTNAINVLGPILVSHVAVRRFGPQSLVAVTVVLTLGTIVFSEILPKAVGGC